MKNKKQLAFLVSVACSILVIALFKLQVFESLELKSLDLRFRMFAHQHKASSDVVIAAIDESSLRKFKENNILWKWPRDIYAALVHYLNRGGAKVIVFDILFPDPDIDRLSSDAAETDGAFAEAIQDAGNVLLSIHLIQDENLLNKDNPLVWQNWYSFLPNSAFQNIQAYPHGMLPIPLFQKSTHAMGVVNYYEDMDGICRRLPLFFKYQNSVFPHLGLAACLCSRGTDQVEITSKGYLKIDDLTVPVDKDGNYLISWYGKGGPDNSFTYYPIGAMITSAAAEEMGRKPILPSSSFKDKIVIVGANAAALSDFRSTPFTKYEPYPGMEIYATMISNFLNQDFLIRIQEIIPIFAILFFAFLIVYSFLFMNKIRNVITLGILCMIAWLIIGFGAFHWFDRWVDLIAPEAGILFSFLVAAVVSYQTEGKARRYLRNIFSKYISPVVISEVIEKSDTLELGGKELTTTIFFSDIKDFTSISEQISASELIQLLNEYFSLTTDVILRYQGLLDKYIGDAIMAIFGAPIAKQDHAVLACNAALDIQHILKNSWQSSENQKPQLITRIGINSGNVVVGNIGSSLRLDYTAIGDSVNLASRLEGVNKVFSTRIILSEFTYEDIHPYFVTRKLDNLRVKGKIKPVEIYELLGRNEEVEESTKTLCQKFQEGLDFYHNKDFSQALKIFHYLLTFFPDDGPSRTYIKRCERFISQPPPQNWDGVYIMEKK